WTECGPPTGRAVARRNRRRRGTSPSSAIGRTATSGTRRRATGAKDHQSPAHLDNCRLVGAMRRVPSSFVARFRALLGGDAAGVRQTLVAQPFNSSTSFIAGVLLVSIELTFRQDYPGLIILVPAAIGLRGNVFGAFGNRLSTSIHAGTFRLSARRDTVL